MKFIRIEDVILNTAHIVCVTENLEKIRKISSDDLPFVEYEYKPNGIRVVVTDSTDDQYFVFKSETLDSFYKKMEPQP